MSAFRKRSTQGI